MTRKVFKNRALPLILALYAVQTPVHDATARADGLPVVSGVEFQPLSAQTKRLTEAMALLGQPLSPPLLKRLDSAYQLEDTKKAVKLIQEALDPLCLVGVTINPESRVTAVNGPAEPKLIQSGWTVFLVKVRNEAGVTAPLSVDSPNAAKVYRTSTNSAEPEVTVLPSDIPQRWMDIAGFDDRPLYKSLSGLEVEYRLVTIYSRDAGRREAKLRFNVGQGTQDLGFRSDLDILFTAEPAVTVTLDVVDFDGKPTTASFLFRDAQGRIYPSANRRLAPDMYFHPQIYRRTGESVILPPGEYQVEWTRGPEYLSQTRKIRVPDAKTHREPFELKRWTHLAKRNWFSGDHHVHAAGCGHYESPTQGITPADMMRQIVGEDLDIGCVLSWGPCWYAQKTFFDGKVSELSTPETLMRYDVEVSGFPSSHTGHLCLLRLKEDDYPNTTRIEEWPSWDLPVLKWGKAQGGVVGFSHSGWGLKTTDTKVPNYEVPKFDGIGANEYIVDVVHDAVDFLSTVDTPAPWELNIWYHTLNCGFTTRISGETDFPCIYGERVGLGRVYVKLADGKLDFDRWCEGVKLGRSYVGDGRSHLIEFQADGVSLGEASSKLKLSAPGTVKLKAKVAAYLDPVPSDLQKEIRLRPIEEKPYWDLERARIAATRTVPLEVIVNGYPVARQEIPADGDFRDVAFDVKVDRSSWVALRIYPSSHTNPIFIKVNDQPIRASKRSAEWCLKSVDQCWSQKQTKIRPEELPAAKDAYDVARKVYRKILAESPVE